MRLSFHWREMPSDVKIVLHEQFLPRMQVQDDCIGFLLRRLLLPISHCPGRHTVIHDRMEIPRRLDRDGIGSRRL